MKLLTTCIAMAFFAGGVEDRLAGQSAIEHAAVIPLDNPKTLHAQNVTTESVTYKGRKALRVTDAAPADAADGMQLVVFDNSQFRDGTIEIELTGEPKAGAASQAPRGFVGLAFRLNIGSGGGAPRYECFYLRPTNGRADDQVRRNHATQYISYPDRPWFKLREEFPGKYESYADMVAGEWIKVKIDVKGKKASLYVGSAPQPVLVVNDLTQEEGQIALWIGTDTIAYFANLRVIRSDSEGKDAAR
jgi:hypothetical protein